MSKDQIPTVARRWSETRVSATCRALAASWERHPHQRILRPLWNLISIAAHATHTQRHSSRIRVFEDARHSSALKAAVPPASPCESWLLQVFVCRCVCGGCGGIHLLVCQATAGTLLAIVSTRVAAVVPVLVRHPSRHPSSAASASTSDCAAFLATAL